MADARQAGARRSPGGKSLLGLLSAAGLRLYAVGVILLTTWLSVMALRYLVLTLLLPSTAPASITGIPTRLTEEVLQTRWTQWPGIAVSENPRVPPAHYHRLEGWVQPDRFNDCTRSGCHAPLPHSKRKEVRAFLNMHATSLHCGVCHMRTDDKPLALTWYDLDRGKAREAPSALQAYALLTSEEGKSTLASATTEDQTRLANLLAAAADEADGQPTLRELARHVAAARPASDAFRQAVQTAQSELPRHFRGEYGAKLALRDPRTRRPVLGHAGTAAAVKDYLRRGSALTGPDRDELLAKVHPLKREHPLHCTECHRTTDSLIAFGQLGYPPARQEALTGQAVFQMVEHISSGRPVYLPGFFGSQASQPAGVP